MKQIILIKKKYYEVSTRKIFKKKFFTIFIQTNTTSLRDLVLFQLSLIPSREHTSCFKLLAQSCTLLAIHSSICIHFFELLYVHQSICIIKRTVGPRIVFCVCLGFDKGLQRSKENVIDGWVNGEQHWPRIQYWVAPVVFSGQISGKQPHHLLVL